VPAIESRANVPYLYCDRWLSEGGVGEGGVLSLRSFPFIHYLIGSADRTVLSAGHRQMPLSVGIAAYGKEHVLFSCRPRQGCVDHKCMRGVENGGCAVSNGRDSIQFDLTVGLAHYILYLISKLTLTSGLNSSDQAGSCIWPRMRYATLKPCHKISYT
jgi:hypothetical protein